MAKPTKPEFATSGAVTEPAASRKATGWISAEKPPHQFFNWLHYQTYLWINYLESVAESFNGVSLESANPCTWDGSTLTFSADIRIRFREEAGDFRENKIAAGAIALTNNQVVVARLDKVSSSPVTLAFQATYGSLAVGQYAIVDAASLTLTNIESETILFVRRDFTHGTLGFCSIFTGPSIRP